MSARLWWSLAAQQGENSTSRKLKIKISNENHVELPKTALKCKIFLDYFFPLHNSCDIKRPFHVRSPLAACQSTALITRKHNTEYSFVIEKKNI